MTASLLNPLSRVFLLFVVLAGIGLLTPGRVLAADSDGDGIDDALDNCLSVYNPEQRNTDLAMNLAGSSRPSDTQGDACDTDDDNDTFLDTREHFMGSDALNGCSATTALFDEAIDAMPTDVNDNRFTNLSDVVSYGPVFNTTSPGSTFDPRYDINASASVNLSDVVSFGPIFNTTCTPASAAIDSAGNGMPTYTLPLEPAQNPSGSDRRKQSLYFPETMFSGGVYSATGESYGTVIDLEIPGRGMDFVLVRKYRSGMNFDGRLGNNWDFNHNRRLFIEGDLDVVVLNGLSRADTYDENAGNYTAPIGHYSRLIKNGDGSYTERLADGMVIQYAAPISSIARITSISDRNDNVMQYQYDGLNRLIRVVDTLGRNIDFAYNLQGRLSHVRDYSGRTVRYFYDGNYDLVRVWGPAITGTPTANNQLSGRPEAYSYSSGFITPSRNHNLLTVTAPREAVTLGIAREVYAYDALDRVVTHQIGGTNASGVAAGGTTSYDYAPTAGCPAPEQTCVTDANGNTVEYRYDAAGHVTRVEQLTNRNIRPTDPASYVTLYTYNADGEALTEQPPEGNTRTMTFDSGNPDRLQHGNMLSMTVTADPARGGDQASVSTTYTYDPIYNMVRTIVEPRGTDGTYVPQNGGAQSAARYTTTFTSDYEEGCDFTAIGANVGRTALEVQTLLTAAGVCGAALGDVNQDTLTNQVNGNNIRTVMPAVQLLAGSQQALDEGTTSQTITEYTQYHPVGYWPLLLDDGEWNRHIYEYYSEQDPDGDGTINNPSGNATTGGYLRQMSIDTASHPARQTGENPTPTNVRTQYRYDAVGHVTRVVDGRGVATDIAVNPLGETLQVTRAAAVNVFAPDPPEPLPLVAEAFLSRFIRDYNGNVIVEQAEDRGNTSQVDGNMAMADMPAQYSNLDPTGGTAYHDTVYVYDALDRRVQSLTESGTVPGAASNPRVRYRYDRNGNQVLVMNPAANLPGADPDFQASNVVAAVFDERDQLATSTQGGQTAQGRSIAAHADIAVLPSIADSPLIATHSYAYDDNGNLATMTDAEDTDGVGGAEVTTYMYDGLDRRVSEVDAAGGQTFYQYDPAGNRVSARVFGPIGGPTPTGNGLATFTQPLTPGSFTQTLLARSDVKYDEASRVFETNDHQFVSTGVTTVRPPVLIDGPTGGTNDGLVVNRYEYDRLHRLRYGVKDDTPLVDLFHVANEYDGASRLVDDRAIYADLNYAYDDNGNKRQVILEETSSAGVVPALAESFTTNYSYDALNRLVRSCEPTLGLTFRTSYNSRGNVSTTSDAQNPLTAPDPAGLCGNINSPGNTRSHVYDGLGRRLASVADLRVGGHGGGVIDTSNPANPDGRIVSESFFDVNSRSFAAVDDGSLPSDGNTNIGQLGISPNEPGNVTRSTYDALNRRTVVTYQDGSTEQWTYTRDGLVATHTDQVGNLHTYTYDALHRLVRDDITRNTGAGVIGTTLMRWEYDALGRLRQATDNNDPVDLNDDSTIIRAYDSMSRMLEESQQVGTAPPSVVSSRYNGDGNRVALIYPNNRQINYAYDTMDRLVAVQDNAEGTPTATMAYIGTRLLEQVNQNGTKLTYRHPVTGLDVGYDSVRRPMLTQHLTSTNAPISVFAYQYDRMGNRTQEQRQHSGRTDVSTYDSAYRLTQFIRDQGGPGTATTIYALDGQANWTNQGTPDNRNRYTQFGGQPHQHDAAGNLKNDNVRSYGYDALNRLVHVNRNVPLQTVSTFKYDATGRQAIKNVLNTPPFNDNLTYAYDGGGMISQNSGATGTTTFVRKQGTEQHDYFSGDAGKEWFEVLVRNDRQAAPGQPHFYHADQDGDTATITNQLQQPVERYTYDAYGVPRIEDQFNNPIPGAQASQQGNPLLMSGARWDPETVLFEGLYKPGEGRSISETHTQFPVTAATISGRADLLAGVAAIQERDQPITCRCDTILLDPGVTLPELFSDGGDRDWFDALLAFGHEEDRGPVWRIDPGGWTPDRDPWFSIPQPVPVGSKLFVGGLSFAGPAVSIPEVWRIDPVPWNRDTGPAPKIDDLIDADPGCRHDIIVDFRECVTPSHLEFLEPSVPPVTTSSKLFVGGLSWNTGAVVEPSSCELNFQTDGPIICQALFQRLEPRAPAFNGPPRIFLLLPTSGPSFMPVTITGSRAACGPSGCGPMTCGGTGEFFKDGEVFLFQEVPGIVDQSNFGGINPPDGLETTMPFCEQPLGQTFTPLTFGYMLDLPIR